MREDRPGGRFILRNAFDSRNKQTNDYIDRELEKVRDLLLQTTLRKTEAINQAQINGEPIFTFDSGGHGAQDFEALTREVLIDGYPRLCIDAVQHLRDQGKPVPDMLLAHTSPLTWEQIGFSGVFLWDRAAATADRRRPFNLGRGRMAA